MKRPNPATTINRPLSINMRKTTIKALIGLAYTIRLASGERQQYTGDDFFSRLLDGSSFVENTSGQRVLQQQPSCTPVGANIVCEFGTSLSGADGSMTVMETRVECPFSDTVLLDFRSATGCSCITQIFKNGAPSATCPCSLCPSDFGSSPISVSCIDQPEPTILGTCTSFDCNSKCNGTCVSVDVCNVDDDPATAPLSDCELCENEVGEEISGNSTDAPVASVIEVGFGAQGCFSQDGMAVSEGNCSCHESCAACIENSDVGTESECITCMDGSPVEPLSDDGTGICGGSSSSNTTSSNNETETMVPDGMNATDPPDEISNSTMPPEIQSNATSPPNIFDRNFTEPPEPTSEPVGSNSTMPPEVVGNETAAPTSEPVDSNSTMPPEVIGNETAVPTSAPVTNNNTMPPEVVGNETAVPTSAPISTQPPVGTNATEVPTPSPDGQNGTAAPTSPSNIFDRPNTTDAPTTPAPTTTTTPAPTTSSPTVAPTVPAPFQTEIGVFVSGLSKIMNEKEIASYVKAFQAYLDAKKHDDTVKVRFISQKFIQTRRRHRSLSIRAASAHPNTHLDVGQRRRLETMGVEVRTLVTSHKDETPGLTTIQLVDTSGADAVAALKAQDAEAFAAVDDVQAFRVQGVNYGDNSKSNATQVPRDFLEEQDEGNGIIMWLALVLLLIAIVTAFYFTHQVHQMLNTGGAMGGNSNEEYQDFLPNDEPIS